MRSWRRARRSPCFPEGISHDEPELQPLKTGAARIALGAMERHGPLPVRIVPVGLTFEEKGVFRSRALLVVGEAIDPSGEAATDEREAAAPSRTASRRDCAR